jgi:Tfp pilus assembly ATPase PilU
MNQALIELYASEQISYEDAIARSSDVEELTKLIG